MLPDRPLFDVDRTLTEPPAAPGAGAAPLPDVAALERLEAGRVAAERGATTARDGEPTDPSELGEPAGRRDRSSASHEAAPVGFQRIRSAADLLPAVTMDDPDSTGARGSVSSDEPGSQGRDLADAAKQAIVHVPGEVIDGRYALVRPIDEGGMGVVWVAHSRTLQVDVAVKLTQSWRRGSVAAKRMEREARTAAKLNHPAVVRIHDFGRTSRGDPYIAMELLQGRSLGRQIEKKGPLSPVQAGQLLLPVVDALVTAHDAGVIHRDLKPDNIFIARVSGRTYPKLLDFSLVKLVSPDISDASLTVDRRGVGTAPYLSPEQVKGLDDVDHRADIWAMCAVLYRVTTGRAPFDGVSRYDVIKAVVDQEPVPTWKLAVGDKAFWKIIERGLRKDPVQRYQSMRELGRELATYLVDRGVNEDIGHVSLRRMWLDSSEPPPPRTASGELGRVPKFGMILAAGVVAGVVLAPWLDQSQSSAPTGEPAESDQTPAPAVRAVAADEMPVPASTVGGAESAPTGAASAASSGASAPEASASATSPVVDWEDGP